MDFSIGITRIIILLEYFHIHFHSLSFLSLFLFLINHTYGEISNNPLSNSVWSASFYNMFISHFAFATGDLVKWLTIKEVEMQQYDYTNNIY